MALKTPLVAQVNFIKEAQQQQSVQLCEKSTLAINADLAAIDLCIEKVIKSDERLKRLKQLITSVTGVGAVTAVQMIISTNEFKDFKDPKKFACHAGVAPFGAELGLTRSRAHVSHYANKKIKSLLHLCAVKAIQCDPEPMPIISEKPRQKARPKWP